MRGQLLAYGIGLVMGGGIFGYLLYEAGKGTFLNDVARAYKTDVESIRDKIKRAKRATITEAKDAMEGRR